MTVRARPLASVVGLLTFDWRHPRNRYWLEYEYEGNASDMTPCLPGDYVGTTRAYCTTTKQFAIVSFAEESVVLVKDGAGATLFELMNDEK